MRKERRQRKRVKIRRDEREKRGVEEIWRRIGSRSGESSVGICFVLLQ